MGYLEIRDTCFVGNNFTRFGTVEVFQGGTFVAEDNYGDADDGLYCNFLAFSDSFEKPESTEDIICYPYDLASCRGPALAETSPSVSPAPTEAPNSAADTQRYKLALSLVIPLFLMV